MTSFLHLFLLFIAFEIIRSYLLYVCEAHVSISHLVCVCVSVDPLLFIIISFRCDTRRFVFIQKPFVLL